MKQGDHPSDDLIGRALDDELSGAERLAVETHLAGCAECKAAYHELAVLSVRVESFIAAVPAERSLRAGFLRLELGNKMARFDASLAAVSKPAPMALRVGGGMAIAAALALGMLFLPYGHKTGGPGRTATAASGTAVPSTFEVEGETFVSLPYSNSDLPLSAPRVVRMQMPVSSLADAGLVFEPMSSEAARPDRSVLADVLLGADGEPLGVHVVSNE
jgi:hypothetical protein